MRIALCLEYDGSHYHGWQTQNGLDTVQSVVERALITVADSQLNIVCAGRTDSGVHAINQIIHFDCDKKRTLHGWVYGCNTLLPNDVRVKWGREMPEHFHARYSALTRRYQYIIYNSLIRPALLYKYVTWQSRILNHSDMHIASQFLLGEQDYTSFRATECQSRTPIRIVHKISVTRHGDFIVIDITANSFLHHMVRNIVSVLILVGRGKKPVNWIKEVLLAKDRRVAAETASPRGLYLVAVSYPDEFNLLLNEPNFFFIQS